jgi:acyl dehydratase
MSTGAEPRADTSSDHRKDEPMTEVKVLRTRTGYFFEEFEVGHQVTSGGRTITESDVVSFAALSGDWNALHTDAEEARRGAFGQRIAHGLLVLSIASGKANSLGFLEGTVLAFREIGEWKFSLPVFFGDTIRLRAAVIEVKPMRRLGGGQVTFKVEILNQRDELVQRGTWGVLVKSRAA